MSKDAGGGGSGGSRNSGIAGGTAWNAEQRRNAAIIMQVGRRMGMSKRDIIIGLMTAMQESGLRNVKYGDRDSLGLFQQRPSQGWGSPSQVTNPYYASKKFFQTLKGVSNRDKMALTAAAQAVQRSAFPDAYAKWERDARALFRGQGGKIQPRRDNGGWMGQDDSGNIVQPPPTQSFAAPQVTGMTTASKTNSSIVPTVDTSIGGSGAVGAMGSKMAPGLAASISPLEGITGMQSFANADEYVAATGGGRLGQKGVNNTRKALVELAKQSLGVKYVWGGTDLKSGVDCSGFIQSVYKEMGIDIPRVSYQQANYGKRVGLNQLRPGDLVAWDNSSRNNGADHIAIYIGNGRIIEAPRTGLSVRIRKLGRDEGAWGVAMKVK